MSGILCYIAIQDGKIRRSSLEVLSRSREIASAHGLDLSALLLGSDAGGHVAKVAAFGATRVYTIRHAELDRHLNTTMVRALCATVEASGVDTLAMASSEGAKDVLGALAVRLSAAALSDVSSVDFEQGAWVATRPVMAAKRLARVRALKSRTVITIRPGSYSAEESPVQAEVIDLPFELPSAVPMPVLRDVMASASGDVDLAEARVVVAAGRGVKDEKGEGLVRGLASILGGAIGATRAVVESGMFPATAQIGQTGKVVSPDLYVALGISGAIQHVAGMSGSRVIVAVNRDPDAPIFSYATYGIVGDLYEVVPLMIEQLRDDRGEQH